MSCWLYLKLRAQQGLVGPVGEIARQMENVAYLEGNGERVL
jgi:hypothetical protein